VSEQTDDLQLSLQDIADLARVKRAVVTTWRSRHKDAAAPFPSPIDPTAAMLRFRAAEVATWIGTTGRGNNPDFGADLAIRATLSEDGPAARSLTSLTALLALVQHAPEGLDGLDADELLERADALDFEDAFLYRESVALGDEIEAAAHHATALASAAYTPGGAVDALLAGRSRFLDTKYARSALRPAALDLIADVVGALVSDGDAPVLEDPYPGCGDLLRTVMGRSEYGETAVIRIPGNENAMTRLARRRLVAHGWTVHGADDELGRDADVVTQIPAVGEPDLDPVEVLARLDEIALGLAKGHVGVVLGPAAVLVDAIRDPTIDARRDEVLRTGRLRSVILLPPGMMPQRPRQQMALWVLGDAAPGSHGEQRMVVADLSEHRPQVSGFAPDVVSDLLTDVVAALGDRRQATVHAFRFGRFVTTSQVIAGRQSLLAGGEALAASGPVEPAGAAHHIERLVAATAEPLPDVGPRVEVRPQAGAAPGGTRLLGDLIARKAVDLLPGNRLSREDVRQAEEGTVPLIGVAEVLGDAPWGARRIDKLALGDYRITEVGDIVFCTAPRPSAVVDVEGLAVVEFPARVLRVAARARDRLVPHLIAADIRAQATDAKDLRAWTVRGVPPGQGSLLEGVLDGLGEQERALRARLDRLTELRTALLDGVAAGVVDVHVSGPREDERRR
jgi:hypothetical protein